MNEHYKCSRHIRNTACRIYDAHFATVNSDLVESIWSFYKMVLWALVHENTDIYHEYVIAMSRRFAHCLPSQVLWDSKSKAAYLVKILTPVDYDPVSLIS